MLQAELAFLKFHPRFAVEYACLGRLETLEFRWQLGIFVLSVANHNKQGCIEV